jgi:hypothetical protein
MYLTSLGNAIWINNLEKKADEAEEVVTNTQQLEEMKSLTAAKNQALEACGEWGTQLRFRMELIFKDKTPKGMQFPNKEFTKNRNNESKMITMMPSLIAIAKEHQAQLKTVGQTPEIIKQGETLLTQLKQANEAQEQYKLKRSTVTSQRRTLFKELYDGVNYLNKMGQMVYGTDSAEGLQFRSHWGNGEGTSQGEHEEEE